MKPEVKPFRYCARSLDTGIISIREAVRFEANPETNLLYAVYYDDWNKFILTEPIFRASDSEELYALISSISQFYHTSPEGLLDFVTTEFNVRGEADV